MTSTVHKNDMKKRISFFVSYNMKSTKIKRRDTLMNTLVFFESKMNERQRTMMKCITHCLKIDRWSLFECIEFLIYKFAVIQPTIRTFKISLPCDNASKN